MMNIYRIKPLFLTLFLFAAGVNSLAQILPEKSDIINTMRSVNEYWIDQHPDPGNNEWARAAYFTGNMDFYKMYPKEAYYNYSNQWANKNYWSLNGGVSTRHADNHCVGQIYLDLYLMDDDKEDIKMAAIAASIDKMLENDIANDWWWIDALYMAMPVFTRLGYITGDMAFNDKMYDLYIDTKVNRGLYNSEVGLWYRDETFKPPYFTPNGKDSYWSRGNGWVFGAHVRVLQLLPETDEHRGEYISTFQKMAEALKDIQREDGFWNASLVDSLDFGGPEASGTSFFTYGMAWGINNGLLDSATYYPAVVKAWNALSTVAVQESGFLGYVQGVGSNPASSQPVTVRSTADFGVGAFLLAGTEVVNLTYGEMPVPNFFYMEALSVIDATSVEIHFSRDIKQSTALITENYSIDGINIISAKLISPDVIKLEVSELSYGTYTLRVEGVESDGGLVLEAGEEASFNYTGVQSVTASSYEPGSSNLPDKTLDVNFDTRWSARGYGEWIRYDLGEVNLVESVDMAFFNGDKRMASFSIYLSDANGDSTLVYTGQSSGTTLDLETFDFDDQLAQYITIVGYGNSSSDWNSITETRINYDIVLGIDQTVRNNDSELTLYPNPLNGSELEIRGAYNSAVEVSVFDMGGNRIKNYSNMHASDDKVKLKDLVLQSGFYIVKIIDSGKERSALLSVY